MAFIMTQDIYTGNTQIDKEHVELFAKINDFTEACSQGKGRDEILATVKYLNSYVRTHFSNEELLQKMGKYPNYQEHKAFHDKYISNLENITKELEKDGPSISLVGKINMQITGALVSHIKTEDVKLAKFLKEK